MSRVLVIVASLVALFAFNQHKLIMVTGVVIDRNNTLSVEFEGDHSAQDNNKHSSSSELVSLALSGALQANSAVRNQKIASLQVDLNAQTGYARAAIEAASSAQVALIAKQLIVQNLQRELEDAERNLHSELAQYQQQLQATKAAQNAAQQIRQQLTSATAALAAVQISVQQSERAAAQSATVAAIQREVVQESKGRVARISEKLNDALAGLHFTQQSTQKTLNAAKVVQNNVAEASAQLAVANDTNNQIKDTEVTPVGFHH